MDLDTDKLIELDNPIAKDRPFLRRNLMPNMLMNLEENLHRFDAVRMFEIGRTYVKEEKGEYADTKEKDKLPLQDMYLGIVYAEKDETTPFFETSNVVRMLADRLGLALSFRQEKPDADMIHPGRYASLVSGKRDIGQIGELHPHTGEKLGIPYRTAMVQINLNAVLEVLEERNAYTPLAQYPSVDRDIALVVDRDVQDAEIRELILGVSELIESVSLFDMYQGEHIEEGKKSLAYHITYRNKEKTLTAEEVDALQEEVLNVLGKKVGAEIRS